MSNIASTTTSPAQNTMLSKRLDRMFERRDTNGDGALSLEEFTKQLLPARQDAPANGRPALDREALFGAIDTDKDGSVTKAELETYARDRIQAARSALLNMQELFGASGPKPGRGAAGGGATPTTTSLAT